MVVVALLVGCAVWFRSPDAPYLDPRVQLFLLDPLLRNGPSSLFDHTRGPEDQAWLNALGYTLFYPMLRTLQVRDPAYLAVLLQALEPSAYIWEVQRIALEVLSWLLHDAQGDDATRRALYAQLHLYTTLYDAAMQGNNRELTTKSFSLLKELLQREQKGDEAAAAQRAELLQHGALTGICRASRAYQPEVSGTAGELLAALVPSLTERDLQPLSGDEKRGVFDGLAQLGSLFQENGLSSESVECFRLSLLLEPNNAAVLTRMGMEQLRLGLKDAAQVTLRKAAKADPYNGETLFHLHKSLLSDAQQLQAGERRRAWEEAVEPLRRAVSVLQAAPPLSPSLPIHPTLSPCYHLLCKALEQLGRVSEAVDAAWDWRLHCPSEAVAYFTHGRLLLQQRRWKEGEDALNLARQLDHSRPQTAYQLALAHYKQQHLQQAAELVEEARQLAAQQDPALHALLLQPSDFPPSAPSAATRSAGASTAIPSPAVPLTPSSASLLCQLDWLSAKLAQLSSAPSAGLAYVDRVLSYRPTDPAALALKAELLQDSGQPAAAYALFANSIRRLREQLLDEQQQMTTTTLSTNSRRAAAVEPASLSSPTASPSAVPSSEQLSRYLSSHPHTAAVLSSIGEACRKERGNIARSAAVEAGASATDATLSAFSAMCTAHAQLHDQIKAVSKQR